MVDHSLPRAQQVRWWEIVLENCEVCGRLVTWVDCPTGGWWMHRVHPADDHDAEAPTPL